MIKKMILPFGCCFASLLIIQGILLKVFYKESFLVSLLIEKIPFIILMSLLGVAIYIILLNFPEEIYKYRFLIYICIFCLCVFFKINGSSIAYWAQYIPLKNGEGDGVLFGVPRWIRSDEWMVNTPMSFSQYMNDFQYYGNIWRGDYTDMFIVYGQPVKDIAVLFRPFHWGYLFLGRDRGFSFWWMGRAIALFAVSFEMGMLLFQKNRKLSFLYGILLLCAPVIQWWFAINGFVEILVWGQLALLVIYFYLGSSNVFLKVIYSLILTICAGGYILVFYPAWQIPFFYVYLALFVWILWEYMPKFEFKIKKEDILIWLTSLLVFILAFSHIWMQSKETISLVMNTVYPGERVEVGAGSLNQLFQSWGNIFFPFTNKNIPINESTHSVFFDFFPIGWILSIGIVFIYKHKDKLLLCLLGINTFLLINFLFVRPELWAKWTLMSNCPSDRILTAIGFTNILLLIRGCSLWDVTWILKKKNLIVLIIAFVNILACKGYYKGYLTIPMIILILLLSIICFNIFLVPSKLYCNMRAMILVLTFLGIAVNPISSGTEVVDRTILADPIKDIVSKDSEGIWVVDHLGWPYNNYPAIFGAPTINSTNVYPDLERWEKIDPLGKYEEVYNRYAHINVDINFEQEPSSFELSQFDIFHVNLRYSDLELLNVKYILTDQEIKAGKLLFESGRFKIYKINEE